jgi:subtilisin family serine protease
MTQRPLLRTFLLTLLLAAGAALAPPRAGAAEALVQRQLLVMLRTAPAHYRPDASYGSDYSAAPGQAARRRIARALAQAHGLRLHEDWPMPALGVDCFVLDAPDSATAVRAAQALAADPRVESAQAMQLFRTLAAPAPVADPLYRVQPAAAAWHLDALHAHTTGRGVRVAVIDSGVAVGHPDLRGQVEQARNFVDGRGAVAEEHGTAVAGIVAARAGNGIGIAGVAPQARLLALRACWQAGTASAACSSFTLAKALQFAIDAHADVINLSLTGPADSLLGRLLDVALQRGIAVVGAVDAQAGDGGFPASHRGVLAIEGPRAGDRVADALRAPDTAIPATLPNGSWGMVSGSSFAAAQVSGLVALLRQGRPPLTPDHLHAVLAPAGLPLPPAPIDACAAMQRTAGQCVCGCATASTGGILPHQ